ncbi:MAG TPA: AmmeMemoRadiSam system protein B [Thermoanaerobaculia bacterium]|nr:AmmeMemoRadiSam system protein B [Thermoanaerobaculia bacterium]
MKIRPPAVAGSFYEGTPERLRAQVDSCFAANAQPAAKQRFLGAVVPHAGLMYSGHVAAALYALADLPRRFVVLCPNHTGLGHFAAINREGAWRTPFGDAAIDTPLADALLARTKLLAVDTAAHAREHSLEVQLPFLQRLLGSDFTFVPICLGAHRYDIAEEIGRAMAEVLREEKDVAVLASSDLNHYEDQDSTLRKDQLAIDEVLKRDPKELWRIVDEYDVSMCGFIPTTTMLFAVNALGASDAQLIKHATSGDINGDYSQVVGYASILIR